MKKDNSVGKGLTQSCFKVVYDPTVKQRPITVVVLTELMDNTSRIVHYGNILVDMYILLAELSWNNTFM